MFVVSVCGFTRLSVGSRRVRLCVCVRVSASGVLTGELAAMADLSFLTRAHGIRVAQCFPRSEEEVGLAVGDVVRDESVTSAARMNGAVVLFLDRVEKVSTVVVSGVFIRGMQVPVVPLATPAVRVTVANVPPFIKEEVLMRELVKHGKVVSRLRKIPSGWKSPRMRQVPPEASLHDPEQGWRALPQSVHQGGRARLPRVHLLRER